MEEQDWEGNQLDKDIITPGNTVYSPENCCFVSSYINSLLLTNTKTRGRYPQGVSFYKRYGKFLACCRVLPRTNKNLGYFTTPEQAYVTFKVSLSKEVAEQQTDPRIRLGLLDHAEILLHSVGELK